MIKANDITKSFGPLQVLKGIDLTVGKGEIVSIVGKSGAGKTTLLHILGSLDKPDSGSVTLAGTDITQLKDRELSDFRNRHIGFVFQFHQLLPEFSALENVMMPALIAGIPNSKATNVNSCWYALQSMRTKVVLILGGTDKGNDYTEIESLVRDKVRALVFLGVDNTKLHRFFDQKVAQIEDARSMEEAVTKAYHLAVKGDTVLLSPCCASFDLFKSYEDRGTQFKRCVRDL